MIHKFHRYISRNIPENAISVIKEKSSLVPKDSKGQLAVGNALYSYEGNEQRNNVEPKSLHRDINKDMVNISHKGQINPNSSYDTSYLLTEHSMNRRMRIMFTDGNHMQYCPMVSLGRWMVQLEPLPYLRSFASHMPRCSDDPYQWWGDRSEILCTSMEAGKNIAESYDYAYDIIYPHIRYHEDRSYSDNFQFIKENVDDIDIMDELEVDFDILNKLI